MVRPKTIETEELLRIARETFLEKGVGAPVSEIARRAGISDSTIFQRFSTKEALFTAALGFPKLDVKQVFENLPAGASTTEKLESALLIFLEYLIEAMPILSTLISHPSFSPAEFTEKFSEAPINSLITGLAGFLEEEKRAGRVGDCDPRAVTGVFFAAIHSFAMFEHMGVHKTGDGSNKTRIHLLMNVLWEGIKPVEKYKIKIGKL